MAAKLSSMNNTIFHLRLTFSLDIFPTSKGLDYTKIISRKNNCAKRKHRQNKLKTGKR